MAGLFGFGSNYNKPGPGIEKDAPPKRSFVLFFDYFGEKFWGLVSVNAIFAIFAAVFLCIGYFIYLYTSQLQLALITVIPISVGLCALTYVTRQYARDEAVFLMHDLKQTVKGNWSQGLIIGVINYIFVAIFSVILPFYWNEGENENMYYIIFFLMLSVCLIFLFVQFYLYLMTVTFDLKIFDIFKNSLIFAFVNFWRNLLLAIVLLVITFLCLLSFELVETPLLSGITVILLFTILFSGFSFLKNFAVWPRIQELLITPNEQNNNTDSSNNTQTENAQSEKEVEWIFVNGKMERKDK